MMGSVMIGSVVVVVNPVVVNAVVVNAVVVNAVVVDVVVVKQVGRVIVLVSRVTAPVLAKARPIIVAPVVTVIDVSAMMVPMKWVLVPKVADLVTCQKTLQGLAPRIRTTLESLAVTRSLPIWKIQTLFGSFSPSSVRVPVICMSIGLLYIPPISVRPPSSAGTEVGGGLLWPAALLYATVRSFCAPAATASALCTDPVTVIEPVPVIDDPGETPRSPVIVVGPVFVTAEPPRTAKDLAVPRGGTDCPLLMAEKRTAEVRSLRNMIFSLHKFNAISKLDLG
jgi:hypothetical protein